MKYAGVKVIKYYKAVFCAELNRKLYKSIFLNVCLSKKVRQKAFFLLSSYKKNTSLSIIRNRCVYSTKARAVLKFFKIARWHFRFLVCTGQMPGVRKANW